MNKTTINISSTEARPLYDLAEALGFTRAGGGNLTALVNYQLQMVKLFGIGTLVIALSRENLEQIAKRQEDGT